MKPIFSLRGAERSRLVDRRRGELVEAVVDYHRDGATTSFFGEILGVADPISGAQTAALILKVSEDRLRRPAGTARLEPTTLDRYLSISLATLRELRPWSAYPERRSTP